MPAFSDPSLTHPSNPSLVGHMLRSLVFVVLIQLVISSGFAAITVDGQKDPDYGSPVAVQTIETSFGNATDPTGLGSGGELNAAYARIEAGRLFLLITGNVENNFNKLNVFIDSVAGGEQTLASTPLYDFEHISQNFGGLTFDAGFAADYHLYARWGSFSGNVFTVDIVERAGGTQSVVRGNGAVANNGTGTGVQTGSVLPSDMGLGSTGIGEVRNLEPFLTSPLDFGFDNTNTAGVGGNGGAAADPTAAAAVLSGFEFSVALADLGNPGDELKVHLAYGNSNNNYHSNQILPGLPVGTGSLGGDGQGGFTGSLSGIDFDLFAGEQFFTLTVPVNCDFDGDGSCTGVDIDQLTAAIAGGTADLTFDLTGDGAVNGDDLSLWLVEAGNLNLGAPYLVGDADLNGFVDGQDFIAWNGNKFTQRDAWTGGDFDANGIVDGQDFILWNGNKFTSSTPTPVPEPAAPLGLLLPCWLTMVVRQTLCQRRRT